jgi:hypothetical protein
VSVTLYSQLSSEPPEDTPTGHYTNDEILEEAESSIEAGNNLRTSNAIARFAGDKAKRTSLPPHFVVLGLPVSVLVCAIAVKSAFSNFISVSAIILATGISLPLGLVGVQALGEVDYIPASAIGTSLHYSITGSPLNICTCFREVFAIHICSSYPKVKSKCHHYQSDRRSASRGRCMSSGRPQLRSQGRLRVRCAFNRSVLWPDFRCSRGCIRLWLVIHVLLKDISCTGPDVPGPQRVYLGFGCEALHWERPARTGRQLCHSLWLLFRAECRYKGSISWTTLAAFDSKRRSFCNWYVATSLWA